MAKLTRNRIKQDLCDQLERNGMIGSYCQDMVNDYMELWDISKALAKDIKERGVTVETELADGRLKRVKNESVGELLKTNAQMLKILDSLELKAVTGGDTEDDELCSESPY